MALTSEPLPRNANGKVLKKQLHEASAASQRADFWSSRFGTGSDCTQKVSAAGNRFDGCPKGIRLMIY
jgi:hypothetical protein